MGFLGGRATSRLIVLLHLIFQRAFVKGLVIADQLCDIRQTTADYRDAGTLSEGLHQYPARNLSSKNEHGSPTSDGQTFQDDTCQYTSQDAFATLETIEKMVNSFYHNNEEKLRLRADAGVGLIMLDGQLRHLLEARGQVLSPNLRSLLEQLRGSSHELADRIFDQVMASQEDRKVRKGIDAVRRNVDILSGVHPWRSSLAITKHFDQFKKIGNEKEVFDSHLDFRCLTTLLDDCSHVPQLCKVAYPRDIYSQYMLVHQIMYQHIGQQRSCASHNPEMFKDSESYGDQLCSKAYLEAEFLESHGFPTRFVDLFAEQVGFCGLMGYPNFMRVDWLREILSWREGSASGCMADLYRDRELTDVAIQVPVVGRKDGKSEEECLLHLTSVSLIALSMNLRYMVDVCEPSLFDDYFAARV